MTIQVSCQCGETFQVPEQFAGRRAACPKCKQPLVIPVAGTPTATPTASPMSPGAPAQQTPATPIAAGPSAPVPQAQQLPTASPTPASPTLAGPPTTPTASPVTPVAQATAVAQAAPLTAPPTQPAGPFQINTGDTGRTFNRPPTGEPIQRRSNNKSGKNMMIGICVVSVLIIGVGLTVFLLNQESSNKFTANNNNGDSTNGASTGDNTIPVGVSQASMITENEAQTVVDTINRALDNGNSQPIQDLIDVNSVCDIALSPYTSESSAAQMNEAKTGFKTGVSGVFPANITDEIDFALADGGDYRFLRFRELDGYRTALFRFQLGGDEGGINYHELLLGKVNGQVKVVDLFVYTNGERFSQTFRRAFLPLAQEIDQSTISRLLGGSNVSDINQMIAVSKAIQSENPQRVLSLYDQLPANLKQDKNMLMNRIQAGAMMMSYDNLGNILNAEPYLSALSDFKKFHPNDKALPLLMIDYHVLKGELDGALSTIDALNTFIGGDAYLLVLKADTCHLMEDIPQAKQFLNAAIEQDPNLPDPYYTMLDIAFVEKDNDAILEGLKKLYDLGIEINLQAIPELQEFALAPQFDEYFKYISQ